MPAATLKGRIDKKKVIFILRLYDLQVYFSQIIQWTVPYTRGGSDPGRSGFFAVTS